LHAPFAFEAKLVSAMYNYIKAFGIEAVVFGESKSVAVSTGTASIFFNFFPPRIVRATEIWKYNTIHCGMSNYHSEFDYFVDGFAYLVLTDRRNLPRSIECAVQSCMEWEGRTTRTGTDFLFSLDSV
jgi:hypothetical protein